MTKSKLNRAACLSLMAAALAVLVMASPVHADDFSFSFTNTVGNVSGTVTGEILGLTDGTTGPAAEVILESYPAALFPDVVANGNIMTNEATWGAPDANFFTESGGTITGGNFVVGVAATGFAVGFELDNGGESGLEDVNFATGIDSEIEIASGIAGLNITPLSSVPEPSSLLLLGVGLVALTVLKCRTRIPRHTAQLA